jgi:hypothetical protein
MNLVRFAAIGALSVVACKSTPDTTASTTTTTTTSSTAASSAKAPFDVTWTKPASWTTEPSVGMRKATYRIAKVAGDTEDATLSVIVAGGSIEDNVARWRSQFDSPHDVTRKDAKVGDLGVNIVEMHGTYTGGGMMVGESPDPRPGWTLLGAIVQTSPQPYFFKMLGPDKTIAAARPDFQALVDSIRAK